MRNETELNEYVDKIIDVAYYEYPLLPPKQTVHNIINALIKEYTQPFINSLEEANKTASYWIAETNKKDAEIIQLRYDLSLLTKRVG